MGKNFRCPLCGSMVSPIRLDNSYPIDIFVMHGLGKGRGFSFEKVEDSSLFERIKTEIINLYARFFTIEKTAVVIGQLSPSPEKTYRGSVIGSPSPEKTIKKGLIFSSGYPIAKGLVFSLKGVKING